MAYISEIKCDNPACDVRCPSNLVGKVGGMTWHILTKAESVVRTYTEDPEGELHFCSWTCIHAFTHTKLPDAEGQR